MKSNVLEFETEVESSVGEEEVEQLPRVVVKGVKRHEDLSDKAEAGLSIDENLWWCEGIEVKEPVSLNWFKEAEVLWWLRTGADLSKFPVDADEVFTGLNLSNLDLVVSVLLFGLVLLLSRLKPDEVLCCNLEIPGSLVLGDSMGVDPVPVSFELFVCKKQHRFPYGHDPCKQNVCWRNSI